MITIFRNIHETSTPFYRDIDFILNRIKLGASESLVQAVRAEKSKQARQELKKKLPAICFSGTFKKRADSAIIQHSGFICLDFDNYDNAKQMLQDRQKIMADPYTYAIFTSPGGDGLKVIVKIPPNVEQHREYFQGLDKHFANKRFDKTSLNVSRVCYESYDPKMYLNKDSLVFDKVELKEREQQTGQVDLASIPIRDESKIIDILLKWWERKYPMTEGVRNQHAYVLSAAFNDFGVDKSMAEEVLMRYAAPDFPASEIRTTINSAYSQVKNFGTKYYEDEERMSEIKSAYRRGVPKKELRSQLEADDIDSATIDNVMEVVSASVIDGTPTFWEKQGKNNAIKIVHIEFKKFLEDNGFFKYAPSGSVNFIFVRVQHNLVEHTSEKIIKDFVLNFLYELGDMAVYNYFAEYTKYFKEDFLTLLDSIDINLVADTKDVAHLYYRNCAVRVTKDSFIPVDYFELGGYVWKDNVIDRDFVLLEGYHENDYQHFIMNICHGDMSRIAAMESTIGFMLHAYKNQGYCPAVILNDEQISDNPEGGTGKGLFMKGLSQMKKMVTIDGKSFTFEHSFAYQLVSADTQILLFDDVRKHFDFERLFSVVTEGLTLEKKNKDAIKIPFSRSPKIAITTNYAIKGTGNSFARRKWELELYQYYTKSRTPLDEFGRLMFDDWDEFDWRKFDDYMVKCLKNYLKTGLVQSTFVNLNIRQFSAATCHEFIEWCGVVPGANENPLLVPGIRLYKNTLYEEFVRDNPDYGPKSRMTISRTKFYRWLDEYGKFKYNRMPTDGKDLSGRWLIYDEKL
jgi:hypothetical protein